MGDRYPHKKLIILLDEIQLFFRVVHESKFHRTTFRFSTESLNFYDNDLPG
jgi:hypothetical protein